MNNIYNMFKKILPGKDTEKKLKEEEDPNAEINLTFEINQLKSSDVFNNCVKDLKIGGVHVESYEYYNKGLNKLIAQYRNNTREIDYRYLKIAEKEGADLSNIYFNKVKIILDASDVDKMKMIGKIGLSDTKLDTGSLQGQGIFSYNNFKIESKANFTSIRTNNCVFKGKWVYECQLNSNCLQQIGWCQMNTRFSNHDGVGDDETSYAIDGYRVVAWHAGKTQYGQMWDMGDILGVGINMDNQTIEFFLNGVSMGVAFKSIPVGENIAYFPGISFSYYEKCTFNFGKAPFNYTYAGYEPIDLPNCMFNGAVEITAELLDLLKHSILKVLVKEDVKANPYIKLALTNKIFNFLAHVSFKDIFIFKTLITPFLYELCSKRPQEFKLFFDSILMYLKKSERSELVLFLFDNLCNMIEEFGIMGVKSIEDWKNMITIFHSLFELDAIVELWIENGKTTENLKNIFNTNYIKMNNIAEFIKKNLNGLKNDTNVYKVFKHLKDGYYEEAIRPMEKLERVYQEYLTKTILLFLTSSRSYRVKLNNDIEIKTFTLKSILLDFVNKGHEFFFNLMEMLEHPRERDYSPFYKNFIINLYSILSEYYSKDLHSFGIETWFSRLSGNNLYHDEIGLGGTITHVTTEYISHIDESLLEKKSEFHSELNHRIIKISSVMVNYMKDFVNLLEKSKQLTLSRFLDFSNGTDHLNKLFRMYFYLFNIPNQILIYKFCFFLVKWINTLIRKNKYIVYFIPKSISEIFCEILKFMYKIKSKIIYDRNFRLEINKSSPLFENDDFIYEIVYFYTYLFSDNTIANPEIKETLILIIKYFMKKKEVLKIYEEKKEITEMLIKGLLDYMSIESLFHIACEIIVKIVKPSCFGEKESNTAKKGSILLKRFFEENSQSFQDFMDNYTKLINKVMTEYTISLNECNCKILVEQSGEKSSLLRKLTFTYVLLCDLMKILEFLILSFPNEFFNINSLNYSRLCNFLKNLSSRILFKPYLSQLLRLLEMTKPSGNFLGGLQSFIMMAYSTIGIFINIDNHRAVQNFNEFIQKFSNISDLDLAPFHNLKEIILTITEVSPEIENQLKVFDQVLENLNSIKVSKKRDRTMSTEEWEETNKNENLCIICYSNLADRILVPCKHCKHYYINFILACCNECLLQYLSEKSKCFICNAEIETTIERKFEI